MFTGTSLVVQRLRLCFHCRGQGVHFRVGKLRSRQPQAKKKNKKVITAPDFVSDITPWTTGPLIHHFKLLDFPGKHTPNLYITWAIYIVSKLFIRSPHIIYHKGALKWKLFWSNFEKDLKSFPFTQIIDKEWFINNDIEIFVSDFTKKIVKMLQHMKKDTILIHLKSSIKFCVLFIIIKKGNLGTSLVVQWLRLRAPNPEGPGFNPWSGN